MADEPKPDKPDKPDKPEAPRAAAPPARHGREKGPEFDLDKPPSAKELEEARREKFGKKAGTVRADVDPRTGRSRIVYIGEDGKPVD